MRLRNSLFAILTVGLCACGDSKLSSIPSEGASFILDRDIEIDESIRPEFNLGQYAKAINKQEIITVLRDPDQFNLHGIVKVELPSKNIQVIETSATDARDLQISDGEIAYRKNSQVFRTNGHGSAYITSGISKLVSFFKIQSREIYVVNDTTPETSRILVDENHSMTSLSLDGQVEFALINDEILSIWLQSGQRTIWKQCSLRGETIECDETLFSENALKYFGFLKTPSGDFLSFLNEADGCLYLAELSFLDKQILNLERVDGTPNESYVGMDPALFNLGSKPGIIYLDARSMKNRIAVWDENLESWKYFELNKAGTFGFYNQILDNDEYLEFTYHAFRDQDNEMRNTFENMHWIKLNKSAFISSQGKNRFQ